MDRQRLDRIREIFEGARELRGLDREAWLEAECSDDDALLSEVGSLLAEYDVESSQLEPGAEAAAVRDWLDSQLEGGGDTTDRNGDGEISFQVPGFRILSRLGEGAQGAVYEAEQERPQRKVALKVLRPHLVDGSARRRFEREAETLALLKHPGIAVVHESGLAETEFGTLPYFAMELVRGRSLTAYARDERLDVRQRIDLLARVGDAVAHAHERSVVHRDLKPSNVLVDDGGRPRVLDFGVARVVDSDLEGSLFRTNTGQVIGTLAYMSPEQARGKSGDVDARSDVFALGVVGFELLTGRMPRDFGDRPFHEQVRLLAEGETSLLGSVDRSLRGDVETVFAKAMASEQDRRYPDAAAFARDLRRYLHSEPIEARPTTTLYQLQRFVRRRPKLAAAIVTVFALLVAAGLYENKLRREAEDLAYRGALASAFFAHSAEQYTEVTRRLADAPERLRGWEWEYLQGQLHQASRTLEVEAGEIAYAALLPDKQRLFLLELEGGARTVDLETGAEVRFDTRQPAFATAADVDMGYFCTYTYDDNMVTVYSTEDGRVIERMEAYRHTKYMQGHFFDDGRLLAIRTYGRWELFVVALGERLASVTDGGRLVYLSQDESWFVWHNDRYIRFLDQETSTELRTLEVAQPGGRFRAFAMAPNETIFAASNKGRLSVYDVTTLEELWSADAHEESADQLRFSPASDLLISAGLDDTVRIWGARDGSLRATLPTDLGGWPGFTISADGTTLVTAGRGGHNDYEHRRGTATRRIDLYDLGVAESPLLRLDPSRGQVTGLTLSRDGQLALTGAAQLWDAQTGEAIRSFEPPPDSYLTSTAVFDLKRRRLLVDSKLGIEVFDLDSGQPLGVVESRVYVNRFALSPDGSTLVVGDEGRSRMYVLDAETYERRLDFELERPAWHFEFSPDSRRCVTTHIKLDGQLQEPLRVWRTSDWSFEILEQRGERARFSPDGRVLAVALDTVLVLDGDDYRELARLEQPHGGVTDLEFTPDGARLATCGHSKEIRLWDTATWREVVQLHGHEDLVRELQFSPDGRTLYSASLDGTVRLWSTIPLHERLEMRRRQRALRRDAEAEVRDMLDRGESPIDVLRSFERDTADFQSEVQRALLRSTAGDD